MAAAPEKKMHQPAIRIVETFRVRPTMSSAGDRPEAETSLPLTFLDAFWVPKPPNERVFFYRLAPDADADAVVADMRGSLSRALGAFFPLAGRLRLIPPGTADRYELHCRPGVDAVAFTVAECDDGEHDLDSLAADEPREVSKIAPFAPPLPDDGAVFAVQATLLSGGLALGLAMHHAACDGAASTHFLRTWAAAAVAARNGDQLPPPPVIDRTLVSSVPRGLYHVLCAATPKGKGKEFVHKMPDDQLLATFTLSRAHLQRAKDAVAASAAARGVSPAPRCTSLVAALSLVWSCYHRAKPPGGGGGDLIRALALPVDHRSRMRPPLPDTYFGNCVGFALATASTTELVSGGGLLAACAAIAAGIEEAVSGVDEVPRQRDGATAIGGTLLTVAGSPRFRVYDLDLGFGRPAKAEILSAAKASAVAVTGSRAGDGGIEVGVALPPEAMDAFRKCFADAVAGLEEAQ